MEIACLDLEGVLIPEIWINFSERTGIPELRATTMSAFYAAAGFGRVLGALVGGPLWLWGGIPAIAWASAATSVIAWILLAWGLKDWR